LFLGYFLRFRDAGAALGATASAVHAVLEATLATGGGELALIAAQDALASPPRRFAAERL
jgi:pyridoxine kinase